MGLEDIGGIALPKHFASFFDNVIGEIPTSTISMHAHLMDPVSVELKNAEG